MEHLATSRLNTRPPPGGTPDHLRLALVVDALVFLIEFTLVFASGIAPVIVWFVFSGLLLLMMLLLSVCVYCRVVVVVFVALVVCSCVYYRGALVSFTVLVWALLLLLLIEFALWCAIVEPVLMFVILVVFIIVLAIVAALVISYRVCSRVCYC